MKKLMFSVVLLGALMAMNGCSQNKTSFRKSDLTKILESEWRAYKKDKPKFNGGLALQMLSPKGDYFIATGMDKNISNKYHFRIASVTKTFTAAAIMLLQQRGRLNIDDKISANIPGSNIPYLPDTPIYNLPDKKDITIKMLLMHRAGIFDISNNIIPDNKFSHGEPYVGQSYLDYMKNKDKEYTFTFDELIGVNARDQLSFFMPGTAYHYSDTGYSMLGKIIERVSGKTYADFIEKELLVPNGLLDTSLPFKGSDQDMPLPFMRGYVWAKGELEDVTRSNMSPHVAEGNVISTPQDLAQWAKKLLKGEAGLTQGTLKLMENGMDRGDGTNSEYGLGLVHYPDMGYGHAGAHEGYLTIMYYNPKTDVAYAMFTNAWDFSSGLDSITKELKVMMEIADKVFKRMGQ